MRRFIYSDEFSEGWYTREARYDELQGAVTRGRGTMSRRFRVLGGPRFVFPHSMDIAFTESSNGSGPLNHVSLIQAARGRHRTQSIYLGIDTLRLVKVGKRVENDFIGVNSASWIKFAVGMGKDHAIFLDYYAFGYELVPVKLGDYRIVIMNTNKRRNLLRFEILTGALPKRSALP